MVERTEKRRAPRRHDLAATPALEEDGFVAGAGAVGERADSEGGLVFVGGQHVVEAFVAQGLEEVFSEDKEEMRVSAVLILGGTDSDMDGECVCKGGHHQGEEGSH